MTPFDWNDKNAEEFLSDLRIQKTISLVGTNKKILDLGCFTGDIALELKKKGNDVSGADCNLNFVEMTGRKGIPSYMMNFEETFPFHSEDWDLIFAGEIIEHIYKTEQFLKECYRILKLGGEIIISTPNINWISFRIQMLLGKTLPFGIESGIEEDFRGHCRYYTVESLKQTLEKFGFKVEIIKSSQIMNRFIKLSWLADKWPSIGYQLIVKAKKI